jgi:hypothetical protein
MTTNSNGQMGHSLHNAHTVRGSGGGCLDTIPMSMDGPCELEIGLAQIIQLLKEKFGVLELS